MRALLIFISLTTLAQGTELTLLARYPGAPKSAHVSDRSGRLVLESTHSSVVPRLKGIGKFVSSKKIDQIERKQILEEKRKLGVRKNMLKELPADHSHGYFVRLDNEEFIGLEDPFGKDLGTLLSKILERDWIPEEAVTFSKGKLQFWHAGKLSRALLPSQLAECRWESEHWSCEFKLGKIEEKDLE